MTRALRPLFAHRARDLAAQPGQVRDVLAVPAREVLEHRGAAVVHRQQERARRGERHDRERTVPVSADRQRERRHTGLHAPSAARVVPYFVFIACSTTACCCSASSTRGSPTALARHHSVHAHSSSSVARTAPSTSSPIVTAPWLAISAADLPSSASRTAAA